jgi:CYTH domain-containing protein
MTQGQRIEKVRHLVSLPTGLTAEVDLFLGRHSGLQIVEVEFKSVEDAEKFQAPHWFGDEVTYDVRYVNAVMARDGLPE